MELNVDDPRGGWKQEHGVPILVPERRNEVWHQSDQGDWRLAYFDVPLPSRFEATAFKERIEKAYHRAVHQWAGMLASMNETPMTKPMLNPNVFYCPEPDKQDHRRFYMAARVKKTKPDLYPLDTVEALRAHDVDQDDVNAEFFRQMMGGFRQGSADQAGLFAQAQELKELPAKAAKEREARRD